MQSTIKIPLRINLFVVLTLIVFLTPFLMEITKNNYVKLIEDAAYLLMLLYSCQKILSQNKLRVKKSRTVTVLVILIVTFSLIGLFYNGLSLVILQFREFKYLLLLIIMIPYVNKEYFKPVWTVLKLIAAISVPVSIFQWLTYRDEGDRITGILGYGSSGTLTLFVLVLFFTELGIRLYNNKPVLGAYFLFLIPTALNETKITFILFPIMLIAILILTKKIKSAKSLIILFSLVIILIGWAFVYEQTYSKSILDFFSSDQLDEYLYATDWVGDAGRFAKIAYAFNLIKGGNLAFGYGLGSSYYGASSGLEGYVLRQYYTPEMFGGTRPQLFLSLIDFGLLGTFLFVILILILFTKIIRIKQRSHEKVIAFNVLITIIITLAYQPIFYTYQIMYIMMLFSILTLNSNKREGVIPL